MNFTGVSSTRIHDIWPRVEGMLTVALERSGEMGIADLLRALLKAEMQLWVAYDDQVRAVIVTEISVLPRMKVCEIVYVTGEGRHDWLDNIAVIEDWAKAQGCAKVRPTARPGWKRDMLKRGYRVTHLVLEKDIG